MKEILLTQGKVALVDDADFEWLNQWKWYAEMIHGIWYAGRNLPRDSNGKRHTIRMHRVIMDARSGQQIDHCNRRGLDNQRHNLRFCTVGQNHANRKKLGGCSSQYKGVCWNKQRSKWQAEIGVDGRGNFLGRFDDVMPGLDELREQEGDA